MNRKKYGYAVLISVAVISAALSLSGCYKDELKSYNFKVTAIVETKYGEGGGVAIPAASVSFTANKVWKGHVNSSSALSTMKTADNFGVCEWSFTYELDTNESVQVTVYANKGGISNEKTVAMGGGNTSATVYLYLDLEQDLMAP